MIPVPSRDCGPTQLPDNPEMEAVLLGTLLGDAKFERQRHKLLIEETMPS